MAFSRKTWKDTIAEYPNRRVLTDVATQETQTVTVVRSVGTVSQEGDQWNAQNMNDLEGRIGDEFDEINSNLIEYDYTISTTWTSNTNIGDYTNYPYKQTISTSRYNNDSACDCLVFGANPNAFMTETEREEKGFLCEEVQFSTSGITVLASEETTGALTLRVRGV